MSDLEDLLEGGLRSPDGLWWAELRIKKGAPTNTCSPAHSSLTTPRQPARADVLKDFGGQEGQHAAASAADGTPTSTIRGVEATVAMAAGRGCDRSVHEYAC